MKRVTRADRAAYIATHSFPEGYWTTRPEPPHWKTLRDKLRALGDRPDPDAVDEILGGRDDTWLRCSECRCRVEHAVELELGLEHRDPEIMVLLCGPCAHAASALAGDVL